MSDPNKVCHTPEQLASWTVARLGEDLLNTQRLSQQGFLTQKLHNKDGMNINLAREIGRTGLVNFNVPAMQKTSTYNNMKRLFDITLACFLLPLMILLQAICHSGQKVIAGTSFILVCTYRPKQSNFPDAKIQDYVCGNTKYTLLKDTMSYITPLGSWLRRTSVMNCLSYSIIVGHMSFVGPRPALFNQYDLKKCALKRDR